MNLSSCKIVFVLGLPFRRSIPSFSKESVGGLSGLNADTVVNILSVFAGALLPFRSSSFDVLALLIPKFMRSFG